MFRFLKRAAPGTPPASRGRLYLDTSGRLRMIDGDSAANVVLTPNWRENFLINGGYTFAQRQVPGTLTTYSSGANRVLAADRWSIENQNASVQFQRVDTIAAPETNLTPRYYGKYKKITSAGKITVQQIIEGSNTAPLRGRAVRFQAKLKCTVAASMAMRMGVMYGTGAPDVSNLSSNLGPAGWGANLVDPAFVYTLLAPRAVDNGLIVGNGLSFTLNTNWQRYSAVFDIPLNASNVIPVLWSDNQLAVNDELNVSECGLWDGEHINDWVREDVALELLRCQRYYFKTFNPDVAPAQNAGMQGAMRGNVNVAGAVSGEHVHIRFPVQMREAPVSQLVFYNPSAANAFMRNITAGTDATATGSSLPSNNALHIAGTGLAAWTVGQSVAVHMAVGAEL